MSDESQDSKFGEFGRDIKDNVIQRRGRGMPPRNRHKQTNTQPTLPEIPPIPSDIPGPSTKKQKGTRRKGRSAITKKSKH